MKGLGEWNTWWLIGEKEINYIDTNTNFSRSALEEVNEDSKTPLLIRSLSCESSHSWEEVASVESSTEESNKNPAIKSEKISTKRRSSSTYSNGFKRKGSYTTAPARYRPSCHANPSKQRRNGFAITPLLGMSQHDSSLANDVLFVDHASRRRRSSTRRTSVNRY